LGHCRAVPPICEARSLLAGTAKPTCKTSRSGPSQVPLRVGSRPCLPANNQTFPSPKQKRRPGLPGAPLLNPTVSPPTASRTGSCGGPWRGRTFCARPRGCRG
jgi:hypothetical protein